MNTVEAFAKADFFMLPFLCNINNHYYLGPVPTETCNSANMARCKIEPFSTMFKLMSYEEYKNKRLYNSTRKKILESLNRKKHELKGLGKYTGAVKARMSKCRIFRDIKKTFAYAISALPSKYSRIIKKIRSEYYDSLNCNQTYIYNTQDKLFIYNLVKERWVAARDVTMLYITADKSCCGNSNPLAYVVYCQGRVYRSGSSKLNDYIILKTYGSNKNIYSLIQYLRSMHGVDWQYINSDEFRPYFRYISQVQPSHHKMICGITSIPPDIRFDREYIVNTDGNIVLWKSINGPNFYIKLNTYKINI